MEDLGKHPSGKHHERRNIIVRFDKVLITEMGESGVL